MEMLCGAAIGAMIAAGILLDRLQPRPTAEAMRRRNEIASKIALHLDLKIKGDVWTLTMEDFDVILDALTPDKTH